MAFPNNLTIPGGYNSGAGAGIDPVTKQGTGTTGTNDPQVGNYAGYGASFDKSSTNGRGYTMSLGAGASALNVQTHVYDPWGPTSRNAADGRGGAVGGRQYQGAWVNPYDTAAYPSDSSVADGGSYRAPNNGLFKYNQMLMTVAENFDPFMQKQEAVCPHWWINRIPRRAFQLFNGIIHQTNIYRGGLSVYSGLGDWEDMANDPTSKDACAALPFKTYQYAWETRAWSGKKTAWGSDPICLDIFKFTPKAIEQLGWILETGVKFGTDIQNIWNRDMFIYHSVMAGRSYVMSNEYRGTSSGRYVYEPFCKLSATDGNGSALVAEKNAVEGKPFIVIDATNDVEPVNFEALQLLRRELERMCPDGAVGSIAGGRMYALGISSDDVDKYIRGNQEERKYYIEGDPAALIKGYDIAPTTFRKWLVTEDGDQLRFRFKAYIPKYTLSEAKKYGYVGAKEFGSTENDGKAVYIAVAVDPMRAGKPGINGAPIPEANPDYDLAELAIAPVFINNVYTNEFVGDVSTLGHGTYFGVVKGLNGQWGWYNIQSEKNPDMKIGNFKGVFEIVPKPETRAIYATSFVYRRCAQPLKSLCPVDNVNINPRAEETDTTVARGVVIGEQADVVLADLMSYKAGDSLKFTLPASTVYMNGMTFAAASAVGKDITAAVGKLSAAAATGEATGYNWTYTVSDTVSYTCNVASGDGTAADLTTERTFTKVGGTETIKFYATGATAMPAYDAMVFAAPTQKQKSVQFVGSTKPADGFDLTGAAVEK